MNKRYLLYGIIILLVGTVFSYESGQQFLSNLANPNNTLTSDFTLGANSTAYINVTINTESFFSFVYNSTGRTNSYLLNSYAFHDLKPYFNSTANLSRYAYHFSGRGAFYISEGPAGGAFPYQESYAQYIPAPNYTSANTTTGTYSFLPNDTYYMVFRNPGPGNVTIVYSYYVKSASSASLTGSSSFAFGMLSGILLISGFAIAIFSLIKRSGPKEGRLEGDEVGRTYDEIESEARAAAQRKTKSRPKKSRREKRGMKSSR